MDACYEVEVFYRCTLGCDIFWLFIELYMLVVSVTKWRLSSFVCESHW